MFDDKTIVGLAESVTIFDNNSKPFKVLRARIDSGATVGSIDESLVKELNPKSIGIKTVRSSHGVTKRNMVLIDIELCGKKVSGKFSVFDRSDMRYPVLIGQDVLIQDFVIDPRKDLKIDDNNRIIRD